MANLMNFIQQPGASSPLLQRSPVGIGGMGLAGPAGRGSYAGPGTRGPDLLSSLGQGMAMAYDPSYSRMPRSGFGTFIKGGAMGMQLHRQAQMQNQAAQMEWAKLQAGIEESRMRRQKFQWEMDQARSASVKAQEQEDARLAMLQTDESLGPEAVEAMKAGGPAYEAYIKNKYTPKTPKVSFSAPEEMEIGGKTLWVQRSSDGKMNVLSTQDTPESGTELGGRRSALWNTLEEDENLTDDQRMAIFRNDAMGNKYLESVIANRGGGNEDARGVNAAKGMDSRSRPRPKSTDVLLSVGPVRFSTSWKISCSILR